MLIWPNAPKPRWPRRSNCSASGLAFDSVCFGSLGDLAVVKVVVEVIVSVSLVAAGAVAFGRAHLQDVVPRGRVLDDAFATQTAFRQPALLRKHRVVENVHRAGHPVLAVGEPHFQKIPALAAGLPLRTAHHVAPDVQRPDGGWGIADHVHGLGDVIAPDTHVPAAAFRLDTIVPAMAHHVAVNIRVGTRCAAKAAVRTAADGVVIHVLQVRPNLVVTDHVVARAVSLQRNALGPGRVGGILGLIPGAAIPARVMHPAPLDDETFER